MGRLFRKKLNAHSQCFHSKQPHIAALHHCLFIAPSIPPDRKSEKHRPTAREKASWQQIQASLGSAEQLCLIKSLVSQKKREKKKRRVLHDNSARKREAAEDKGG